MRATEAWQKVAPAELAECCRPTGLRTGTLEVACESSAASYALTRWFQGGGRAALAAHGSAVLRLRSVLVAAKNPVQPNEREGGKIRGAPRPRDR